MVAPGQPRERLHAVAEQADAVVAAAARVAVDRAERVGLEGDHHACAADRAGEPAVPGSRAGVLSRAAAGVARSAAPRFRAHHREHRHRALPPCRADQPAHLVPEVRPREAPQPERPRLARDLPDERGLVPLAPVAVHPPLVPGGRVVVHEQRHPGERVAALGGGRRSAHCERGSAREQRCERETSYRHAKRWVGFPAKRRRLPRCSAALAWTRTSAQVQAQSSCAAATRPSLQASTLARSTHSSTACAPQPSGPNTTVGMPAAWVNAASIQ